MPDFTVRADSVDVEQIMKQIRARIREKRGVDYTEDEIRELARVKLEKFLDPAKIRSELLEHYRRGREAGAFPQITLSPAPPNYAFEDRTVYESSRSASGRVISGLRRLLNPLLKLFINPNPVIQALHLQSAINVETRAQFERVTDQMNRRLDVESLYYELLHNLVVETTRLGIEVKNLKMRAESLTSRLDFDERRARALEGVVQYRPGSGPAVEGAGTAGPAEPVREGDGEAAAQKGEAQRSRRRRRRRGGRGGGSGQPQGRGGDVTDGGGDEAPGAAEDDMASHAEPPAGLAPAADSRPADAPRDGDVDSTDQ